MVHVKTINMYNKDTFFPQKTQNCSELSDKIFSFLHLPYIAD